MPGQAIVSIRDKQWQAYLATTYAELTTGLGGQPSIPAGTGMIFDTGWQQVIQITTVPMLFPLDIAFFSEEFVVTEVYRNIEPGYLVTSMLPARYFLEVSTGELEGIESGDVVSISVIQGAETTDWIAPVVSFAGVMMVGAFIMNMGKTMADAVFGKPKEKPVLYGSRGEGLLPQTESWQRSSLPEQPRLKDELEFLPDSPEFLAYTIEDIGYRDKLDTVFQEAIARARQRR